MTTKKILTKEAILTAKDCEVESLYIKEWDGDVLLKPWDGVQRDKFEIAVGKKTTGEGKAAKVDIQGMKALAISLSIVNEEGVQEFTEADASELNKKSGGAIDTIWTHVQKKNHIGEQGIEDAEKNLSATPSENNGSDSQDS